MPLRIGDVVYFTMGLERKEPQAFKVTDTMVQDGVPLVKIDHETATGWWEEKFFVGTPTADAGKDPGRIPSPVVYDPDSERASAVQKVDELLTMAIAAWVHDDKGAVDLVTKALETLRMIR